MWHRRALDDLDDDIRDHLERETEANVRRGLAPDEAARAARLAFGHVLLTKEAARSVWIPVWWDQAMQDARYGLRLLRRAPVFSAIAVLTLALGIGANTAIFSVVHAVMLKPMPYARESDRLVRVMMNVPPAASPTGRPLRTFVTLTPVEAGEVQARARSLTRVAIAGPELLSMRGYEGAARLNGARLTASTFSLLGARAAFGRTFDARDEAPDADAVVVLSFSAFQEYFGGDPGALQRTVIFDSVLGPRREYRCHVIGVMPPTFTFPNSRTDFWMPFSVAAAVGPRAVRGAVLAALADDVSTEAAVAEVGPLVGALRHDKPGVTYEIVRERDEQIAAVKPALVVLSGAVGVLLLIACVNVANLLLARATARRQEIAIRATLGAGRARLIRQTLVESAVLAGAGGVAGVVVAAGAVRALRALIGTAVSRVDIVNGFAFPRFDEITINAEVLAFTVVLSLVTGLAFGIVPALHHVGSDLMQHLKTLGRATAARARPGVIDIRNALVVAQVAAATVLLIAGALLGRSFVKLTTVALGYRPDHLLTFQINVPPDRYDSPRLRTLAEAFVDRLRTIPGVRAAAYANQLPTVGMRDTAGGLWNTADPHRAPSPSGADARLVSRDYLGAIGVRLLAGRAFRESDGERAPRVLIVNALLAGQEFPGESPIGRHVFVGRDIAPWEIVGVVDNVREFGLDREPEPQFFIDMRQWPAASALLFPTGAYFVVQSTGDPMGLVPAVRSVIREMDPDVTLFHVAPMEHLVASTIAAPRTYAVLMTVFAGVGLILAIVGVGGLIAYTVIQRTREIGIRMALGATRSSIVRLVLRQSAILTVTGLAIGLAVAAAAVSSLERLLFGVTPFDAATFVVVPIVFGATVLLASALPARKAAQIDPLVAIRVE